MITHLVGTIIESTPAQVVIEVSGVGYELQIPSSSFASLPQPGKQVKILTHLVVREDAHILYGFATSEEREVFRILINTVSGIGPRIALNVLSGMNPADFARAVSEADTKRLSQISGLGKKTAERIVVELKDKLKHLAAGSSQKEETTQSTSTHTNDAVAALVSLGYKAADASKRVEAAAKMLGDQTSLDRLIRAALAAK